MIVCAAIKIKNGTNDLVICGLRHANCVQTIIDLDLGLKLDKKIDGFIDHKGVFLDRKEAFKHALECGQINQHSKWYREDNNDNTEELFSEDLY